MEVKLFEIAERIRCLREILGITVEEMAAESFLSHRPSPKRSSPPPSTPR